MTGGFLLVLALLAMAGGWLLRRRIGRAREGGRAHLSDEMIRRIEEEGRLHRPDNEPLDLDQIRREEEQFWDETWDEPEEL